MIDSNSEEPYLLFQVDWPEAFKSGPSNLLLRIGEFRQGFPSGVSLEVTEPDLNRDRLSSRFSFPHITDDLFR